MGRLLDWLYWFRMLPPWQRTPLDGGDMEDTRKLVEIVPADFSADVGRRAQDGQPI